MQLAGKIANDIDIVASLTDENTPIQPEGNTQTLQEIDKVAVEIKSTNVGATLGDFWLNFDGTEFARLNRKLQGAKGNAQYFLGSSSGNIALSGAITRGKFHTNQFQGIEGVQGPYRLVGKNNERNIIIIAGTERVYVDGQLTTRGETYDYTIDYASGEIIFRPRRLINNASRIVVDFEYTDRQYTRSLLAAKSESNFLGNNVKFNATYFRESDDPNSTIDISLSDSDKAILKQSGSDRFKATKSGVVFVGRDSTTGVGKGQYVRIDTTVNGTPTQIYRYAPGDTAAVYSVAFTFIGEGQGDYIKESIGNFRWVGIGAGSYLPLIFLPLPELHQVADFDMNVKATDFLNISGEYALSSFDANRFSNLNDAENNGSALKFGIHFNPKDITVAGTNIGSIDVHFQDRYVSSRFSPIDRTNEIEFNRKWNIESFTSANEEIREGELLYFPKKALKFGGGLGKITHGKGFNSTRTTFTTNLFDDKLPKLDYNLEIINSDDIQLDNTGHWLRQRGLMEYSFGRFVPGFRYEGELKETNSFATDTLKRGSFRYNEFTPRLAVPDFLNMSFAAEFQIRNEDSVSVRSLSRASHTFSQTYLWQLKEWHAFSSSFDLTRRQKEFTDEFRKRGNTDGETFLVRSVSKFAPLNRGIESDLFYEVSTERSAKLERVFVRVPKGTGNYRYLGDLNGNGVPDENEFELSRFDGDFIVITVPTDALFPVIDLKASTRFRLTPSRFLLSPSSFLEKALMTISAETYLRVEEKSTEKDLKQIYLLHFSKFQNDSTTIAGSNQITQDLYVFENNPEFSIRLRFNQRKGFTQFALQTERSLTIERSARIRWHLVKEIFNQTDYINKIDRVQSGVSSNRARDISSNALISDFSYRPEQNIEVGFRFDVTRAIDYFPLTPLMADINDQSIRFLYAFQGIGQLRLELEREEVLLDGLALNLPFELTGGKLTGKSWLWRAALDYRFGEFIQATLNYDGRSEGNRRPIHTARAEVRAFF